MDWLLASKHSSESVNNVANAVNNVANAVNNVANAVNNVANAVNNVANAVNNVANAVNNVANAVNNVANAVNLRGVCNKFLVEGAADSQELQPSKGWFVMLKIRVRLNNVKLSG